MEFWQDFVRVHNFASPFLQAQANDTRHRGSTFRLALILTETKDIKNKYQSGVETWVALNLEFLIMYCTLAASIFASNRQLQTSSLAKAVANHIKFIKTVSSHPRNVLHVRE